MKILRNLLVILALFVGILGVSAQNPKNYTIKGVAIDSLTKDPLSFATVVLKDSTALVKAVATEVDGKFSLRHNKAGKYTLYISYVGYPENISKIELGAEGTIDLGKIQMAEGNVLGEVVVRAPLISTDIDKTVYNTSADPETPALTALEMMRKVPMLTVDGEDNLQFRGQTNYKILVNGKSNSMMSKNYKEVLRSMPAASIKSVEVITNPPVKYEAEGIAGIINIITNRKTNDSYNGSIGVRGDNYGGKGANAYIAAALGKFNVSARGSIGSYRRPGSSSNTNTEYLNPESRYKYLESESTGDNTSRNQNFSLEASYEIDTFNLISLSAWGWGGNSNGNSNRHTEFFDEQKNIITAYDSKTTNHYKYGGTSGTLDWQKTYMKPDKTFTVSYQFNLNPTGSGYETYDKGVAGSPIPYPARSERSDNTGYGDEHTFQLDFFDPLTKVHNIEFGVKYIFRPSNGDTFVETLKDDQWIENPSRKNDLDYKQHITGAYGGYQFKLKKFSAKAGLRAEYTINDATFKLENNVHMFNRFFNVVPYVTTSYKLTDSKTLSLGYTQRLYRPSIWLLNPYVDNSNPQWLSSGNPELESEVSHSFNLNYNSFSGKSNLSASFYANISDNSAERHTRPISDTVMLSKMENCGEIQNYSMYVYGGTKFFNGKLSVNLNADASYIDARSKLDSKSNSNGFTYGFGMSISAQPWKNGSINAYGRYSSPYIYLQGKGDAMYYTSIGISQSFFKDRKLRLNLSLSNPFETYRNNRSEEFGKDYNRISNYSYRSRNINFGIQWNFGKAMTQVKKARRGISNDDRSGGGSGGSGSGSGSGGGGGQ